MLLLPLAPLLHCRPSPVYHRIPIPFVYTITEHGDSLYVSTSTGEVFRFHPDHPDSVVRIAKRAAYPIRGLAFKQDGTLYTSSYTGGVCTAMNGTLIDRPKMWRTSWTLELDPFDNIWLAGRQGVFRQTGDTLTEFSNLREAYDIRFFSGRIAVAHRKGITIYDTLTEKAVWSSEHRSVFWCVAVFDSLLTGGCMDSILLVRQGKEYLLPLTPPYNTPWAIVRNRRGTLFLGTQFGLYRLKAGETKLRCIAFKGKCIKSLHIDRNGRLWVGTYFN
ncbi:MAG: hypothetical protein JW863_07810 [Chitinispirillaceae bacterium]|nr:hypothetical protein [Chitinispirillaceae bacterium]